MAHVFDQDVFDKTVNAKAQIALSDISGKTYQQAQDWVDNNVTDLASAKVVLTKIALVVLALLKERDLSE